MLDYHILNHFYRLREQTCQRHAFDVTCQRFGVTRRALALMILRYRPAPVLVPGQHPDNAA